MYICKSYSFKTTEYHNLCLCSVGSKWDLQQILELIMHLDVESQIWLLLLSEHHQTHSQRSDSRNWAHWYIVLSTCSTYVEKWFIATQVPAVLYSRIFTEAIFEVCSKSYPSPSPTPSSVERKHIVSIL